MNPGTERFLTAWLERNMKLTQVLEEILARLGEPVELTDTGQTVPEEQCQLHGCTNPATLGRSYPFGPFARRHVVIDVCEEHADVPEGAYYAKLSALQLADTNET